MSVKVMAVNAGSSSLKFKLFEMPAETVITDGVVERIGLEDAYFTIRVNGEKKKQVLPIKDHGVAVQMLLDALISEHIVNDISEIKGVGHRIVQGGWYFDDSVLVDDEVIRKIDELCDLAPLHNPAHLIGIRAFMNALPGVPNITVFDTSFHQSMSEESFMYAIPYEWYEKYHIRKYGAHGTSHKYVANRCAALIGKPVEELKIVTCHLGNGASLCAIENGLCKDTSMGLTPLEGIPMGTRSGNLDPTVVSYICNKLNLNATEVVNMLNKKSGYLGVSGVSNDSRDLEAAMAAGNDRARLALDIQYKRIADYIGSYYVLLGGIDAIVFTAGIGENSPRCRQQVVRRLGVLGVKIDEEKNNVRGEEILISTPDSKIKVFIIPTDEELVIARDVMRLAHIK
ncbi:MAG: acetate kinase [Bacilli bacterium]|nr:acetate kinase [Bacilli bacterium]